VDPSEVSTKRFIRGEKMARAKKGLGKPTSVPKNFVKSPMNAGYSNKGQSGKK